MHTIYMKEHFACMSYQRLYKSGKGRRRGSPIIVVLLIGAAALLSLGCAYLWQSYDEKLEAQPPSSSSAPSLDESSSSSQEEPSSAVESSSQPSSQEEESSSGSAAPQSAAAPREESTVLAYGTPVPASQEAASSYFDDAMFVGDSITEGIKLYGVMNNSVVISHTGINPETILYKEVIKTEAGTLTVPDAMSLYQPTKIYIMQGANGVAFINQDKFIEYYSQLIDVVKSRHPDATIYIQSILPVTGAKSSDPLYANSKIDGYNTALLELTRSKKVYYLDVASAFKDAAGNLPNEASPKDGIHFGPEYYNKWFDYLKTHTVEGFQS